MAEWRLFDEGSIPEWTTPEWYEGREAAPHLEQEGHRERLLLTAELVNSAHAAHVVDLGAGDGGLLSVLPKTVRNYGYDLQQTNVDAAKQRRVAVVLQDVVNDNSWMSTVNPNTCLVATEMIEHLLDPHAFVKKLYDETPARWLVASSPYTETVDSHYEFHTWAWDLAGYRKLLEDSGWRVLRQETAWISQVLLAERK
jgi:2-polyprenyl-3-methyl-5-hydroxy-6-metoxy-1,4-benzoquinol methylase